MEDELKPTNALPFVIQYRRKDNWWHWQDMEAFDCSGAAEAYLKQLGWNPDINPWEYRLDIRNQN